MSYFSVFIVCLGVFALATTLAGHAFKPELHFSWWTVAGWICFIATQFMWEAGKE